MSVLPGEVMGPEGFQLSVSLSEVHLPRMWVEKHPDKDSQVRPSFCLSFKILLLFFSSLSLSRWSVGLHVGFLSRL